MAVSPDLSVGHPRIESMFDTLGEGDLLAEMAGAQRSERIAVAHRLLAAGRLCQLRMAAVGAAERIQWCIDNWEAVAAEVGAGLGISGARASAQMNCGVELLERLPRLAEVFAAGEVDFRVVSAVVYRTGLITDPQLLADIDAALARRVPSWNRLSRKRVAEVVDQWVIRFDPAALRTARSTEQDRRVEFGESHNGMVEFWGALRAADAAMLDRRLDQLAADAGPDDIRTKAQRRADALAALAAGEAGGQGQVVIHVLAEAGTVPGASQAPTTYPVRVPSARRRLGIWPAGPGCARSPRPPNCVPNLATGPRRRWPPSSGPATCAAGSPAATSRPRSAISTTPSRGRRAGRPTRPTAPCCVVRTTCSRHSGPVRTAGPKSNSRMAESSGPHRRGAGTPPPPPERSSSRNCPPPGPNYPSRRRWGRRAGRQTASG